ncbi:hypothetical protein GQ457_13G002440 [Hibiscus cannabinus]
MAMQVKMEDVDRLSDLPDSILSHILSFLSTKEAVGTSVLSSKWRHLFTSVSNLDFDLEHENLKSYTFGVNSFISFVDKMLFSHNMTNIENFRLKRNTRVDSNSVYRWISAAAVRGVKHLDLNIWLDKSIMFPGVVFTCRTLVTLKLDLCSFVFDVPKSVHLPNLKTLHLSRVEFSNDDSFKNLLSGCISLEDMVLRYWHGDTNFSITHHLLKRLTIFSCDLSYCKIMIDTPNLVYFRCCYPLVTVISKGISLENMQSLVEADINIYQYGVLQADAIPVFTGISNLRSLRLSSRSLKEFVSSLPENVPPCLSFKLKAVEVSGFTDDENCMEMVKYILKNGGALEKLTIRTSPSISGTKRMKIYQVLLSCPRKAEQCCVSIVCQPSCGCETGDDIHEDILLAMWKDY